MTKLNGKVALVTGGGQGIGRAAALALVDAGASVIVTGRTPDSLQQTRDDAASAARMDYVVCDAGTRSGAKRAIAQTIERFGQLDVLINNAQSTQPGVPLEQISDEAISLTLQSGLLATIYHMQEAFAHLQAAGGASVINFGSREGIYGGVGFGIYAANKEAIRGVTRVAAREWGRYGIRANVVCPAALSPAAATYLEANPEEAEMYRKGIALGRFGDPGKDIAPAIVFLASDESRYVTGQTINVDGGQMML